MQGDQQKVVEKNSQNDVVVTEFEAKKNSQNSKNSQFIDQKNKFDGFEEIWDDGTVYKGGYLNGRKNGKGFMKWPNGATYEGEFKSNKINGYGKKNNLTQGKNHSK